MDTTGIFTRHRAALERLAARITGDAEDARDVVADAFAALLEGGPTDPGHAVPWLYVTVRHRAYNRVRGRARAQRRLRKLAVDTGTTAGPESALRTDSRIRALLTGAAANLSERDRIAVSLRHVQEASYEDVAAALGTTPSQARVVVHRATTRLRGHLLTSFARRHGEGDPRVGDELVALLQTPVVVPLTLRARLTGAAREWWRRTQSATGRAVAYVGEAVAPAVAFVAMAAGPVSAGVVGFPTTPVVAAAAPAGTTPSTKAVAAPGAVTSPSDPAAHVPADLPVAKPSLGATIGSPLQAEDVEPAPPLTPSVHGQRRSLLRTLGLGLDLPDPLDAPQGPQADIRSVEIATLAGEDGRPAALRWRVGFAEAPPANLSVTLAWRYAGSACSSNWSMRYRATTWCEEPFLLDLKQSRAVGEFPIELRYDGVVVEATVHFAALDGSTRSLLRPGAELTNVLVGASCNLLDPSGCENGDRAPDSGAGWTYKVEE